MVAELDRARLDSDALQATSLARAGIERVLAWLADPASFAEGFTVQSPTTCLAVLIPQDVFRKRCVDADGLPSFRATDGAPQFDGTLQSPAVLVRWGDAPSVLHAPAVFPVGPPQLTPSIRLELRLFAPVNPDAAATVVSRATVGRSTAVERAELAEGPWRGATQAVFVGDARTNPIPLRVHWGGIAVDGTWDASEWLDRIPRRSETAPVNSEAYAVEPGSDRWAAISASGPIIGPTVDGGGGFVAPFDHLYQHADVPRIGLWGYDALKAYAKRHGAYYATRGTGLLYPDDAEGGLSLTSVLASHSGNRRFLFIDTIDGTPPREDNLDVLQAMVDFVNVDAYVGAHLTIVPGRGRPVVLDAPSAPETSGGGPLARDVEIEDVHYHGVLMVAGVLGAATRTRIVGSLAVLQGVRDAGAFEVWYDAALRRGHRSGFSPVVVKPGSRRAVVDVLG